MRLLKRKRPSHDIFNKSYMRDAFAFYEKLIEILSQRTIHLDILPTWYQGQSAGRLVTEAYTQIPDRTFSRTFGSAFDELVVNLFDEDTFVTQSLDREEYNFHLAFDTARRYKFADIWMLPSAKEKTVNDTIADLLGKLQRYNVKSDTDHEENMKEKMSVNNVFIYQMLLELSHWKHMAVKYKLLLATASSDAKRKFRDRELELKNRYIHMLEEAVRWKLMKQNKLEGYLKYSKSLKEKRESLTKEEQSLRNALRGDRKDMEGEESKTRTGLAERLREALWIARNKYWHTELELTYKKLLLHYAVYKQRTLIQSQKSNIKQLYDSVKAKKMGQVGPSSSSEQIDLHRQLNSLPFLNMLTQDHIEEIVADFYGVRNYYISSIVENMKQIDDFIKDVTAAGFVKRKKEMQKQDREIDQLEMKIIRHLITDTDSTATDNELPLSFVEQCNKYLSAENDKNKQKVHILQQEYEDSLVELYEVRKENSKLVEENMKLKRKITSCRERRRALLQRQKPDEQDFTKYEKVLDALVDNTLKRNLKVTFHDVKERERMKKASLQAAALVNDLTLEAAYVNTNLDEILRKFQDLDMKYVTMQTDLGTICDACKSYCLQMTNCTKYTTQMLYEDNLLRFFVATTVMKQFSFFLHMFRKPIFRCGMSVRNKLSMKRLKRKLIVMRKKLKSIMKRERDTIEYSSKPNFSDFNITSNISVLSVNTETDKENISDENTSSTSVTSKEGDNNVRNDSGIVEDTSSTSVTFTERDNNDKSDSDKQ